jgi:hypothetical protein
VNILSWKSSSAAVAVSSTPTTSSPCDRRENSHSKAESDLLLEEENKTG